MTFWDGFWFWVGKQAGELAFVAGGLIAVLFVAAIVLVIREIIWSIWGSHE